jgi:superfamily I DNA/RNA helicase
MDQTTEIAWLIEEALWRRMRAAPASHRRVGALVERLQHDIREKRFMGRGYLGENRVKLRFTDGLRLPVVVERVGDAGDASLVVYLFDVVSHREGEKLHRKGVASPSDSRKQWHDLRWERADLEQDRSEQVPFPESAGKLFRKLEIQSDLTTALDRVDECEMEWHLSPEQRAACDRPGPVLICGSAGSGKSSVALSRLLQSRRANVGKSLYLTYTETLRDHAERQWRALASAVPDLRADEVDFLTVEQFCRALIGLDEAAARFGPERRWAPQVGTVVVPGGKDPLFTKWQEVAWEEIRSVIKGHCLLRAGERRPSELGRTLAEYERVPEPKQGQISPSLLPKRERRDFFHQVYQPYQQALARAAAGKPCWDDVDLAVAALRAIASSDIRYDDVLVDEAQDLAPVQLALALLVCVAPRSLYLAADVQQSVHPANFSFGRLRQLIHEFGWPDVELVTLRENFRSGTAIVELTNRIALERNRTLQENHPQLAPVLVGGDIFLLSTEAVRSLPHAEGLAASLLIIAEDDHREEAEAVFNTKTVLSLADAKGLERPMVILWRIFESGALRDGPWSHRANVERSRQRFQYSCLTVGISRARETLVIVDDATPMAWMPFAQTQPGDVTDGRDAVQKAMLEVSAAEDYAKSARELEELGKFVAASEFFRRAGRRPDALRCDGRQRQSQRDYREAIRLYAKAGDLRHADECWMLLSAPEDRLGFWVEKADDPYRPAWWELLRTCAPQRLSSDLLKRVVTWLGPDDAEARALVTSFQLNQARAFADGIAKLAKSMRAAEATAAGAALERLLASPLDDNKDASHD